VGHLGAVFDVKRLTFRYTQVGHLGAVLT
jgi:hypothetical protein